MENQNLYGIWEQIEEDEKDYQYFKIMDDEKLRQTLEALKKLGIDKNEEV